MDPRCAEERFSERKGRPSYASVAWIVKPKAAATPPPAQAASALGRREAKRWQSYRCNRGHAQTQWRAIPVLDRFARWFRKNRKYLRTFCITHSSTLCAARSMRRLRSPAGSAALELR